MPFWPVAAREARAAARAPRTYAWRAGVTAVGIATVPVALSMASAATSPGRAVFIGVSALAFAYCAFGGVLRTADAIAEEKRENTLGLLFLTDLKIGDVISGKLLASTAALFFGLLAILPLLVIPVLLGGVMSRDLLRMSICLVNTLFFSISCGFLISTLLRQGWVTVSCGLATMLAFCGGIPLVASQFALVGLISPLSPLMMFATTMDGASSGVFVQAVIGTHLLAWLNLLFTAKYLPKFCHDRPPTARAQVRVEKIRRLRFGGAKTRTRFRTRLLNRNPLFWLAGREQVSSAGLMAFLMSIVTLSLVVSVAGGWLQVLFGVIALHATLLVRMSSAASHSLAEDRKSGALELLLATSLSVRDVLKGRWMALGRQFFGPIAIVLIWHAFSLVWIPIMAPGAEHIVAALVATVFALAMSWIAIGWFGMWMGLRARHPIAAIWSTLIIVVLVPWLAMAGGFGLLAAFQVIPEFQIVTDLNYIANGCCIWIAYLVALSLWTAHRLRRGFREAATDRFSDTQPIDWRPVFRVTLKIAALIALAIGAIWSTRIYINKRGDRALRAALTANPGFTLEEPSPRYVPDHLNLARWDFVNDLNATKVQRPQILDRVGILGVWNAGRRYQLPPTAIPGSLSYEMDEDQLRRLHAASRERPFIQFVLRPVAPMGANSDFYIALNSICYRLAARAERRLLAGEHPLDDILLALAFSNSLTNDPLALPHRLAALTAVIQPIYDGILDARWSDLELQAIQNAFAQSDARRHFEAWQQRAIRDITSALADSPRMGTPFGPMYILVGNVPHYIGNPPPEKRLPGRIKSEQAEIIEAGFGWESSPNADSAFWIAARHPNYQFKNSLYAALHYSLRQAMDAYIPLQTPIDQVVVGCAIERFRLARGSLPKTLDELTQFLRNIPRDLKSSGPLKYHLTENGYVLYSVGKDGVDNGGVPEKVVMVKGRRTEIQGDRVWIYKK